MIERNGRVVLMEEKGKEILESQPQKLGVKSRTVNILKPTWLTRYNRDAPPVPPAKLWNFSNWTRQILFPDLTFTFGTYSRGNIRGAPRSSFFPNRKPTMLTHLMFMDRFTGTFPDLPTQKLTENVKSIMKKIGGGPGMTAIRFISYLLCKLWRMVFSSVEVDGADRVREICEKAGETKKAVVFLPTHRSHIDYLLFSYICFGTNLPMPYIASGDNLNMFLIGRLLSGGGAFFIRRKFNDDEVYKAVLRAYVHNLMKSGHTTEVFIEGGRTRTGFISEPQIGMLKWVIEALNNQEKFEDKGTVKLEDVLLVPVAIDYENVLENIDGKGQGGYAANLLGAKKKPESFLGTLRLIGRLCMGRNSTHGKAFVRFGSALSVNKLLHTGEFANSYEAACSIGSTVVSEQRRVSMITSVAVLCFVLLNLNSFDYERVASSLVADKAFSWTSLLSHLRNLSSSPSELLNLLLCGRTNRSKRRLVAEVLVPKYKFMLRLLSLLKDKKKEDLSLDSELELLCFSSLQTKDLNHEIEEQIWKGISVVETFFQKRLSPDQIIVKRLFRFFAKNIANPGLKQSEIEADARLRMNLAYSCGQLSIILLPFSVVAANMVLQGNDRTQVNNVQKYLDLEVTECLKEISKSYFAGADLSADNLEVAATIITKVSKECKDPAGDLLDLIGLIVPNLQCFELVSKTLEISEIDKPATRSMDKSKLLSDEIHRVKESGTYFIRSSTEINPVSTGNSNQSSYRHQGTFWRPEILNQKLIRGIIGVWKHRSGSGRKRYAETIEKLLRVLSFKKKRILSGKVLSENLRDIDHVSRKRLVKFAAYTLMLLLVRYKFVAK